MNIKFKKLNDAAIIPSYQSAGAAGMDIHSIEDTVIYARGVKLVKTGLIVEIPEGYEIQVRPRSGLAAKYGVTVLNAPGTIDSDYRGEIGVILINQSPDEIPFIVKAGDRIAQLVVAKVERAEVEEVTSVTSTERGEGGFGSTGK